MRFLHLRVPSDHRAAVTDALADADARVTARSLTPSPAD